MKNIILFFALIIFTSCNGLNALYIYDSYYLVDVDYDINSRQLCYKLNKGSFIGIIDQKVKKIGFDSTAMIVMVHDENCNVELYYIIPLLEGNKVSLHVDENKIGPLTQTEFYEERKKMGLSSTLTFSRDFND